MTLFQQKAPKEKLPLLYAAEGTVLTFLFGVASLVFVTITDHWGAATVFYISASCLVGVAMLCVQLLFMYEKENI